MLRLVVETQVWELRGNRIAGKGGDEYLVATLDYNEAAKLGQAGLQALVTERTAGKFPSLADIDDNEYAEEILDWNLLDEGDLTYNQKLYQDNGETVLPELRAI